MDRKLSKADHEFFSKLPSLKRGASLEISLDGDMLIVGFRGEPGADIQDIAWQAPEAEPTEMIWLVRSAAAFHGITVNYGDNVKDLL